MFSNSDSSAPPGPIAQALCPPLWSPAQITVAVQHSKGPIV